MLFDTASQNKIQGTKAMRKFANFIYKVNFLIMNNNVVMKNISEEIRLEKKRRKDMCIFCMYMAVGTLGIVGACYSDTIPQCIILFLVSLFTIVCGIIIKRQGTEDPVW